MSIDHQESSPAKDESTQAVSWWRTSFGEPELQNLADSVAGEHISQGPVTAEFEAKFANMVGSEYAMATTSGSVALLLALMALGVGPGDEVIMTNRTWIATAHAALFLGAKVVLVDVVPDIPAMDVSQIRGKITPRTKVIMPVHLNGRSVDMDEVRNIAKENDLLVVEDAAQSFMSSNSAGFLGSQSDAGCFSLSIAKLISTGQGGLVTTQSKETYDKLKSIGNHGVVDNFTDTWNEMGFNFKYTDLLASFGLAQLDRAPARLAHVNKIYAKYNMAITEFEFPFLRMIPVQVESGEVPIYVEVLCQDRPHFMKFLADRRIQTRPSLPSLHISDYLENSGEFPNSQLFNDEGLILPCGPEQPLENVDIVLNALEDYGKVR